MLWWIPITLGAAGLQVARNAAQRGLASFAGPWAATLVRFLFGLPFALVLAAVARLADPRAHLVLDDRWLVACGVGAAAQILATAALLVCMRLSGFAIGTALQQSAIPLTAIVGLALGEHLRPLAWAGVTVVAGGLAALAWPRQGPSGIGWRAVLCGLGAGCGFAIASNAYRQADLALARGHAFLVAQVTLVAVQTMQSLLMVILLWAADRRALRAVVTSWRSSLAARVFGAAASGLWFTAFALAPAGPVRAVGAVETPMAAMVGRRAFAEPVSPSRLLLILVTAAGVVMAAMGQA